MNGDFDSINQHDLSMPEKEMSIEEAKKIVKNPAFYLDAKFEDTDFQDAEYDQMLVNEIMARKTIYFKAIDVLTKAGEIK